MMPPAQNYDLSKQTWQIYEDEDTEYIEKGTKLRFRIISINFQPEGMGVVATINDHYLGPIEENEDEVGRRVSNIDITD